MKLPSSLPRLKVFRFPREIVAYAVWTYHRFALSTVDVEDLLAERGIIVSREAIRLWVNRFGTYLAACIRWERPHPNDKWHLDEVVIPINGVRHWLWRAVDANSDVFDISCSDTPRHQSSQTFFGKADCTIWPAKDGYHRQTAQLYQANPSTDAERRPSRAQGLEQ